jgi:hypothetical protein
MYSSSETSYAFQEFWDYFFFPHFSCFQYSHHCDNALCLLSPEMDACIWYTALLTTSIYYNN